MIFLQIKIEQLKYTGQQREERIAFQACTN